MTRILVIGASGVLGGLVCEALYAAVPNVDVVRGMRRPDRPDAVAVDVTDEVTLSLAVRDVDVVVNLVNQTEPRVQQACANAGIPSVDAAGSGSGEVLRSARRELQHSSTTSAPVAAPTVLLAGLFPGLSALLAEHVISDITASDPSAVIQHVSVGLLQNTNAAVGATGIVDMLTSISTIQCGGKAFDAPRSMQFWKRAYPVRRVRYDEADVLAARYPSARIDYYTGWNRPAQTHAVAALVRLRVLPAVLNTRMFRVISRVIVRSNSRRSKTAFLTAEVQYGSVACPEAATKVVRGTIAVRDDYAATATATAAVVRYLLDHSPTGLGVCTPVDVMTLTDLLEHLPPNAGIKLL